MASGAGTRRSPARTQSTRSSTASSRGGFSFTVSIGVEFLEEDTTFKGFLANARSYRYKPEDSVQEYACLLMYFVDEEGRWVKAMYTYEPYFFIKCKAEAAK